MFKFNIETFKVYYTENNMIAGSNLGEDGSLGLQSININSYPDSGDWPIIITLPPTCNLYATILQAIVFEPVKY